MAIVFTEATKKKRRAKVAIIGPAGSGKTLTGLQMLRELVGPEGKIAVLDTEHGSASLYSKRPDIGRFRAVELESFHPKKYIEVIKAAEAQGFDGLLIDSLSHAWMGKDGALELVDRAAKNSRSGSSFSAWRDITPLHNDLVEALVSARIHLVVTMRSKTEFVQEETVENGRKKTVIRKVGMQPVQRDGLEYEMDVTADLDTDNVLIIGKTRCSLLKNGQFTQDGFTPAKILREWLDDGAESAPDSTPAPPAAAAHPASEPRSKSAASAPTQPAPAAPEPPKSAPKLPDNPQQKAELDGLVYRLDRAELVGDAEKEIEAISDVVADAKKSLKGEFLADFKAKYSDRYRKLQAAEAKAGAA